MKKICFVDYAHYSFIERAVIDLVSEELSPYYLYNSSFPSPSMRGRVNGEGAQSIAIAVEGEFRKDAYIRRYMQELNWAKKCIDKLDKLNLDLVVVSNTPIGILSVLQKWCRKKDIKFCLWMQDIHSMAIEGVLSRKFGMLGSIPAAYFKHKEYSVIKKSDHIIAITPDHLRFLEKIGVSNEMCSVLPNWADLNGIPRKLKANEWSIKHGVEKTFNIIYSGTLGLKHNPALLLELAKRLDVEYNGKAKVIIVSEGVGADWLKVEAEKYNVQSLMIFNFQKQEVFPDVLASADILTTILESEASAYSVPSKILSYLCSARPILAALPDSNLSSQIITKVNCGVVVESSNVEVYIKAALNLMSLPNSDMKKLGVNARSYAEENFELDVVKFRILTILDKVLEEGADD